MQFSKVLILTSLLIFHPIVSADDIHLHPVSHKESVGFSFGAIIGGLLAGPPGAVIGAAGGGFFGARESETDRKIAALEKELNAKSIELAYQQNELATTKAEFEKEFQKVVLSNEIRSLEKLSQGISYVIYYKTNEADIRHEVLPRIQQLAELVKPYPQIQIQIEGYADHRGTDSYNMNLSKKRIENVRSEFLKAGIPNKRLQSHAYGEINAKAKDGDKESYVFDRRVTINLTLDREV